MSRYSFYSHKPAPVAWTPNPADAANDLEDRREGDQRHVEAVMAARPTGFLSANSFVPGGHFYKANDLPQPTRRHF